MSAELKRAAVMGALLMREVLCELVHQRRDVFDASDPCATLELRTIDPDAIAREMPEAVDAFEVGELRLLAASVLARMQSRGELAWQAESTQPPAGAIDDLLAASRRIVSAIDALPSWAGDSVGAPIYELESGRWAFREAIARAYDAHRPTSLPAVLPWLAGAPESSDNVRSVWWGRMGTGQQAFACDGCSLLIVDDVPDAPLDGRWFNPEDAERSIRTVAGWPAVVCLQIDAAELVLRVASATHLRVGPAAVLDTRLLDRWVALPASLSGGTVTVELRSGDRDAPPRFVGQGWSAIVMPVRLDRMDEDEAPSTVAVLIEGASSAGEP